MGSSEVSNTPSFRVRGTELLATDTRETYRQKIARITLDSMVQFVGLLDAKGTVLEINQVALDGVGIRLSDVEGAPFWTTFWWAIPEEGAILRESIQRAAQGEFVRWDAEIYGRANGTETIIIDASLMPVKDEQGHVVFITAEGRDITEKKAYEREIAKKNKDLQGLLERIRELDEIKSQFFANVSHELRTPLALIIGPADRLAENAATMSAKQRLESARVIGRNARMLLKHVNDLLDISKFEAGKLKLKLQDTDVTALLRLTASHFEVLAKDRSIEFRVEAPEGVIVAIDSEKFQRVLMNLLSNAFKFVPVGGKVLAKIERTKNELIVSIDDSGPGIARKMRKAIFERFRQGAGGANRQFGGTGLGLAIAKEFVEMHHGTLEALDSKLGGARFQAALPLNRLAPIASPSVPASSSQLERTIIEGFLEELRPVTHPGNGADSIHDVKNGKLTLLVVEDNPEMNRFIAECLSSEYNVVAAFDGQEGFEKALSANPALIVTDIMMPRVSGVQMIAKIRQTPELAGVPILLLTAKADEELKLQLLKEGAQDFIAKPFSEKDLLVRVKNLIRLRNSEERYRALCKSMEEGFCTIEVLFDERERPGDFRFLEVNGAFEKQTGLRDVQGRRVRELLPGLEQYWLDIYGHIALTGESARVENRVGSLDRWYEVYANRVGKAENRQVAIFFNDITSRKRMEIELQTWKNELATRVEQRTVELATARVRLLEEANERKRLEGEVAEAVENEQLRLGQELHDGLAQELTGIAMMLEVTAEDLKKRAPKYAKEVTRLREMLVKSRDNARNLAKGFYPVELHQHGLLAALRELSRKTRETYGIFCEVEAEESVLIRARDTRAIQLFRIAQEAVHNAVKHAQAKTICIRVSMVDGVWTLTVRDDGVGLRQDSPKAGGMGMQIMQYRARMIGGRLTTRNAEGGGTEVTCTGSSSVVINEEIRVPNC